MRIMSDVLGDAIGRREVIVAARAQMVFRRWDEAVGPHLAKSSQPDRYEHGTLWVSTVGSAWSQEIMLQKHIIVDRLNAMAGEELFQDIRTSRGIRKAKDILKPQE